MIPYSIKFSLDKNFAKGSYFVLVISPTDGYPVVGGVQSREVWSLHAVLNHSVSLRDSRTEDDSPNDEGPWIEQALAHCTRFIAVLTSAIEGDSSSDRGPAGLSRSRGTTSKKDSSDVELGWL